MDTDAAEVMVMDTDAAEVMVMVAAGGAVAGMVMAAPAGCGLPVVGFGLAAGKWDQTTPGTPDPMAGLIGVYGKMRHGN
jgi:hypothetical protein